jgi:DNA mismatch repair ATPase MutS
MMVHVMYLLRQNGHISIQAYLGYYVASKELRFFTQGPIQGISCRVAII